ncbi:hypothetical protein [Pyxidicoccus caerfyrddinensis]|uniref:hypothetical protein n=1 Tax=Pyxidicoccus caerfyrddinensis TaxID=2709663 RepID=UPI0013DCE138|nr:hypothetical protein [Pyxidicoccus caerfyrddinensis]
MIAPPTFDLVRAGMARVAGWLVLLGLTLLCVPSAFAGDSRDVETYIRSAPEATTTSTTADFTFDSNVADAGFWCLLDEEQAYEPCEDGTWHREGLAPGPHSFWVYAYDRGTGKVDESPARSEWTVEELPPPLDAGSPDGDGGVPGGDAGTGADGGPSQGDAGTGDSDGGTPTGDAGTHADGGPSSSDAGTHADGGPSPSDAGTGDSDGGTSGNGDGGTTPGGGGDGGTPAEDAGTADEDGGTGDDAGRPDPVPPDDTPTDEALDYLGSGMGCTGAPAPGAVAGLLLLVLALRRRRGS